MRDDEVSEITERKTCERCKYSGCYFETALKTEKFGVITKNYTGLKCPECGLEFDFMEMK